MNCVGDGGQTQTDNWGQMRQSRSRWGRQGDGAKDRGNGGRATGERSAVKHRSMSPFYAPVATGAKRGREAWAQLAWAARLTELTRRTRQQRSEMRSGVSEFALFLDLMEAFHSS